MDTKNGTDPHSQTPPPTLLGLLSSMHSMEQKELPVFPLLDSELENATSRFRPRSSSSIQRPTNILSLRPLSARRSNETDESVPLALASACNEVKRSISGPPLLPPVPSKPPSPEANTGTGGKVVRRRGLQKNLERGPSASSDDKSVGESCPAALVRHSTISGGCILASSQKSITGGKIRRAKTAGDNPTAQNSTDKILSRRNPLKTKEDLELARIEAMRALVASLPSDDSSTLMGNVSQFTRHVLKQHGTKAFTEDNIACAVARVYKDGIRLEKVDAVMQVIQYMAEAADLGFLDVVGQILWRNRQAASLREKPQHKQVAEDVSWVISSAENELVGSDVLKALDDVFDMFAAGKGKGIGNQAWSRVVKFVEANPVLKRKVNHCDADRLWYAATHKPHMEVVPKEISRRAFKELLLAWCEAMDVHPLMVFVAIGSHANYSE